MYENCALSLNLENAVKNKSQIFRYENTAVVSLRNYNHFIADAELCLNIFFFEFKTQNMDSLP